MRDSFAEVAGPLGVGAVIGGLNKALSDAADISAEASILAGFLNISVEEASGLQAVFSDFGLDREGFLGAMEQFVTKLAETPELADELGVALGPDGVLDPVEAIKAAIDKWDLLTPTEKVELFGEEGVRSVERIIASGKDLETLIEDLPEARIITPEEQQRIENYTDAVRDLKALYEQIVIVIAQDLGPAIGALTSPLDTAKGIVSDVADGITDWGVEADRSFNPILNVFDLFADAKEEVEDLGDEINGLVSSTKVVPVEVEVRTNWVNGLPPGFSFPARPTTNNVTINLGRAATAADVAAASGRYLHQNGRPV